MKYNAERMQNTAQEYERGLDNGWKKVPVVENDESKRRIANAAKDRAGSMDTHDTGSVVGDSPESSFFGNIKPTIDAPAMIIATRALETEYVRDSVK